MTVVYAHTRVKGLDGVYASPAGFNGEVIKEATLVVTNDSKIKKAYADIDVTVKDFTADQKAILFPKQKSETK